MPPEPSVTSACDGPRLCTLRYSSALLPNSFERPGPKSVSPATYCSGVEVVVWWRWIVDMRSPCWNNYERCGSGIHHEIGRSWTTAEIACGNHSNVVSGTPLTAT